MNAALVAATGLGLVVAPHVAAGILPAELRAAMVAVGLLAVPGYLVVMATAHERALTWYERPAVFFVCSIGALTPALLGTMLVGRSLDAFLPLLAATLAIVALLAARSGHVPRGPLDEADEARDRALVGAVLVLVVLLTATAWQLTATGSIDRWWYLAYVRGYADASALDFAEPILGSGYVHPRFTFNTWLLMLAVWARQAGIDPAWLYERVCPLVLVPLAFSALLVFARALFGSRRMAAYAGMAGGLLWASGALLPIVTRLPEDKLLAVLIVAPVSTAACLRMLAGSRPSWLVITTLAIAVQATTHALVYAVVLIVLVPYLGLVGWTRRVRATAVLAVIAILALGSLFPAYQGLQVRSALARENVTWANGDHPVVRVHRARDRIIELDGGETNRRFGSFVVQPRLLLHPLTILALLALFMLGRRPPEQRMFLTAATLVPLALAFVPPLATAAGRVVPPWMVYRVLWAVPLAALLAVTIDELGRLMAGRRWLALTVVVLAALPGTASMLSARTRPERTALATPAAGPLREALATLEAVPERTVVAAAAELSERIPALTGKQVLASSDRGTIVFAGTRGNGEERLRARAAIYAGLWKPSSSVPDPTHVLFEPDSQAERYCATPLYRAEHLALCTFEPRPPLPGVRLREKTEGDEPRTTTTLADMLGGAVSGLHATCTPEPQTVPHGLQWPRPGPWSVAALSPTCTIRAARAGVAVSLSELRITPLLGEAAEELTISARASHAGLQRWSLRTRRRVRAGERLRFALPQGKVDELVITITPSFLPFLKLAELAVVVDATPVK